MNNPTLFDYGSLAIVDGEVIPDDIATIFAEGGQADVPVMIGSTADEGTTLHEFIVPPFGEGAAGLRAYANAVLPEAGDELADLYPSGTAEEAQASGEALLADVLFTAPMRIWARATEDAASDAYLYWFTWAPPIEEQERYGAFHAAEIGYVFGNLDLFGAVPAAADHALVGSDGNDLDPVRTHRQPERGWPARLARLHPGARGIHGTRGGHGREEPHPGGGGGAHRGGVGRTARDGEAVAPSQRTLTRFLT